MEKKLRLVPLILLLLYFLIIGNSENYGFEIKIGVLTFIVLTAIIIAWMNYKKGNITKQRLQMAVIFSLFGIGVYLYLLFTFKP